MSKDSSEPQQPERPERIAALQRACPAAPANRTARSICCPNLGPAGRGLTPDPFWLCRHGCIFAGLICPLSSNGCSDLAPPVRCIRTRRILEAPCHDVAKLYSVRRHLGDMAHIRDTAPVTCRGFLFERCVMPRSLKVNAASRRAHSARASRWEALRAMSTHCGSTHSRVSGSASGDGFGSCHCQGIWEERRRGAW